MDVAELHKKMLAIEWNNDDDLFTFLDDDEPRLTPKVEEIAGRMHQLKNDPNGLMAYDQLSLKYWPKASYFEDFIREEAWDYLDRLPNFSGLIIDYHPKLGP